MGNNHFSNIPISSICAMLNIRFSAAMCKERVFHSKNKACFAFLIIVNLNYGADVIFMDKTADIFLLISKIYRKSLDMKQRYSEVLDRHQCGGSHGQLMGY